MSRRRIFCRSTSSKEPQHFSDAQLSSSIYPFSSNIMWYLITSSRLCLKSHKTRMCPHRNIAHLLAAWVDRLVTHIFLQKIQSSRLHSIKTSNDAVRCETLFFSHFSLYSVVIVLARKTPAKRWFSSFHSQLSSTAKRDPTQCEWVSRL